jgi:hypothetical protein
VSLVIILELFVVGNQLKKKNCKVGRQRNNHKKERTNLRNQPVRIMLCPKDGDSGLSDVACRSSE